MKKVRYSKRIAAVLMTLLITGVYMAKEVYSQSYDYWTNKETFEIRYNGYIQFVPNYKTDSNSGYGLEPNRRVKQAYINYSRDGKSVIGGRKYTSVATSGSKPVSVSASCWDSLLWGDKYTTKFNYGWIYK